MITLNLSLVFLIGITLGSFANVCIYRLPKNKNIVQGRSFCPKCKKGIKWFDNIPLISFLLLNRKCRNCRKIIPIDYFIVELIAGVGLLTIFINYNNYLEISILSIFFLIFLIIFFIDLKHFIIPDSLNYLIIFIAITINFLPNLNINFVQDINQSILGGIVGYSSIWIIIYIYRKIRKAEGMGLGDAKLMAGVGLLFGWQSVPIILFFSSVIALLIILPFLINILQILDFWGSKIDDKLITSLESLAEELSKDSKLNHELHLLISEAEIYSLLSRTKSVISETIIPALNPYYNVPWPLI